MWEEGVILDGRDAWKWCPSRFQESEMSGWNSRELESPSWWIYKINSSYCSWVIDGEVKLNHVWDVELCMRFAHGPISGKRFTKIYTTRSTVSVPHNIQEYRDRRSSWFHFVSGEMRIGTPEQRLGCSPWLECFRARLYHIMIGSGV